MILVTGGAGFIGSNFILDWLAAGQEPVACPHAVRAAQRVLSLPMSADLAEADQDRVVAALAEACRRTAAAAPA